MDIDLKKEREALWRLLRSGEHSLREFHCASRALVRRYEAEEKTRPHPPEIALLLQQIFFYFPPEEVARESEAVTAGAART